MLLPIANSQNVETLFGSAFESAITAAVSIFTIKLSLYITNQLTDAMWGVLIGLVPFDIPERLRQVISSIINMGAEVFLVAVLLGYAWSRTRQQITSESETPHNLYILLTAVFMFKLNYQQIIT